MKFDKIASDAFQKIQLNAGIILTDFDPATPTVDKSKILGATADGTTFATNPVYVDFGDGIDNVPPNTKQLKRLQSVDPAMSGTFKTADTAVAKALIGAADVTVASGKITPRAQLVDDDFIDDLWWVGDYSDKNGATNGGYLAIHMTDVLNTSGFQLKSNNRDKGDFAFDMHAHYDMTDTETLPFEIYIKAGTNEPT